MTKKTALLFPDGNRGVPVVQPPEMGPEFNEFGPEGLAARTAAAERDNQERMGFLAARDAEADRMMGINSPIGSSAPQPNPFSGIEDIGLDAREAALQNAGRMSAQEKMFAELSDVDAGMPFEFASSTGVSRDGRTDAEILAEAQAMIAARRSPESDALLARINTGPADRRAAANKRLRNVRNVRQR